VTKSLEYAIDVSQYDLIHAHYLLTDGGIAYKLSRKYGIPYIITIRNTNVNRLLRYRYYLRGRGNKILNNASTAICLTPSYLDVLKQKYRQLKVKHRDNNMEIVPNTVSQVYHATPPTYRLQKTSDLYKVLYVGDHSKNKQVHLIIDAVSIMNKRGIPAKLTLVGGGRDYRDRIKKYISQNAGVVTHIPWVTDTNTLISIYDRHDVSVLVSKKETFGVVQVESIFRNTPIVYRKGQGIDGWDVCTSYGLAFEGSTGDELASALINAKEKYKSRRGPSHADLDVFTINAVAQRHVQIYESAISSKFMPS